MLSVSSSSTTAASSPPSDRLQPGLRQTRGSSSSCIGSRKSGFPSRSLSCVPSTSSLIPSASCAIRRHFYPFCSPSLFPYPTILLPVSNTCMSLHTTQPYLSHTCCHCSLYLISPSAPGDPFPYRQPSSCAISLYPNNLVRGLLGSERDRSLTRTTFSPSTVKLTESLSRKLEIPSPSKSLEPSTESGMPIDQRDGE